MDFKALGDNLGLDEDEYRELIDLFIQSGGLDLVKLEQALTMGDADQVMRCAHTIKGASGNLGLTAVSAAARRIEEQSMHNRLEGLEEALRTLKFQFEAIRACV
ncbi:MAG: Hpt domain-containing protein [Desulfobacteraceae bacterium]|nr:MAG: Hpt domain-containing protein [Desulfobacteraceae bacterium]